MISRMTIMEHAIAMLTSDLELINTTEYWPQQRMQQVFTTTITFF